MESSRWLQFLSVLMLGVTLTFAVSCGKDSVLDEAKELKAEVCACKDKACVAKLEKSSKELEARLSKLTGRELEQALELSVAIMECSARPGAEK